jgi:hypothetical protein
VNAAHILVSSEPRIKAVVEEALDTMKDATKTSSNFVSEMPAYSDIFQDDDAELLPVKKFDTNSPAFFIHSSGKSCFVARLGQILIDVFQDPLPFPSPLPGRTIHG